MLAREPSDRSSWDALGYGRNGGLRVRIKYALGAEALQADCPVGRAKPPFGISRPAEGPLSLTLTLT